MSYILDSIDLEIVELLSKNGKLGNKEVAASIGLSVTPTFERIRRLEKRGIIKGYVALIDQAVMGKGLKVFCQVSLNSHSTEIITEFEEKVVFIEEVSACYHIAGDFHYSLFIEVANMEEYQIFLKQKLANIPNISNVQTAFVMSTLKN
jgi:Lrp/AsnC family transcriptional regulator, leucine-responsive regulatory protein